MFGKVTYFVLACFVLGSLLGIFDVFSLERTHDGAAAEEIYRANLRSPFLEKRVGREQVSAPVDLTPENRGAFQKYLAFLQPQEFLKEYKRLSLYLKDGYKGRKEEMFFLRDYLAYELGFKCPEEAQKIMDEEENLFDIMLQGWAQTDFEGAMEYLMDNRNRSMDSLKIFDNLCAGLVRTDPQKAVTWGLSQSNEIRLLAFSSMADAIGAYHPGEIPHFVERIPLGDFSSTSLLEKIARNWGAADWEATIAWINNFPEKSRKNLVDEVFRGVAVTDLKKATLMVQKLSRTPDDTYGFAKSVVGANSYGNASFSREELLGWLQDNIAEHPKANELSSSAVWSEKFQSMELDQYVLKLPEGKIRDGAVNGILTHWEHPVYEDKARFQNVPGLIDLLKDERLKRVWRARLQVKCIMYAPKTAKKWIAEDTSPLNEQREMLLKECEKSLKNPEHYVYPYAF